MQGRKYQVAGERRLHGDLGRFGVTNLTDHDDVGVLAHDRAQPVGEGQADLRFDVNLIDAAELIFHRIFDGNDFFPRIVDFLQCAVKRRRLAAAGRPGNQDHAMGL